MNRSKYKKKHIANYQYSVKNSVVTEKCTNFANVPHVKIP